MTQTDFTLLNILDLIIVLFLIWSVFSGAKRGILHTFISILGRIAIVMGGGWLAKLFAPALSHAIVFPIVSKFFASQDWEFLDKLQIPVTQAIASIAEGIAFFLLFLLFMVALSFALAIVSNLLNLFTRFPPLGWLNRLAGAALGLVSGIAVILLALWLCHAFRPDLFDPLGILSPNRIADTVLLRNLLLYFPIL